ncbi:hypothetical protein LAZ67_10001507 [Cordylochernes scorpioides]|uniref:Helix-turn-helix domain-containing protein n=1 Tax=Cordylochernes scorpioides TaxID=51811 RepID=A0ABY6KZN6_9ARAC|nr:hypothetical protein LAZ67_10001507 [Cordylochernes scorpioides]
MVELSELPYYRYCRITACNLIGQRSGHQNMVELSFKPNYIHFTSYCPLSHKINTVKTLTKRIHTHCSQQNSKIVETQKIINNLQQAGYPITFILKHFHKSKTINNPINKTTDIYRAICYIPFSQASITIANYIKNFGIQTYYSNSPNIGSIIKNPLSKNKSNIIKPTNKKEAIYSLECNNCHIKYVGETGRRVSNRIYEHKRNIINQDNRSLIFQHCKETGHTFALEEPKIHYNNINSKYQRLIIESLLSRKHNSINRKIDLPEIYNTIYPSDS